MSFDSSRRDRLEELLAASAVEGLCLPQREELDALLMAQVEIESEAHDIAAVDNDLFERAVAALDVGMVTAQPEPELPAHLLETLTRQGEAFVAARSGNLQSSTSSRSTPTHLTSSPVSKALTHQPVPAESPTAQLAADKPQPRESYSLWNSLTALSVCVVLALALVWIFWPPQDATLSIADAYARLAAESGSATIAWGDDVEGDIVWNQEKQEGYMRFRGVASNNPAISQYQLWIVDSNRSGAPVDGGVFDISATQTENEDVYVRVQPKLRIKQPGAFAVTVEEPGGVVVSNQDIVLTTASWPEAN